MDGKVLHYHSDGTGRDGYIVVNEGGFSAITHKGISRNSFWS